MPTSVARGPHVKTHWEQSALEEVPTRSTHFLCRQGAPPVRTLVGSGSFVEVGAGCQQPGTCPFAPKLPSPKSSTPFIKQMVTKASSVVRNLIRHRNIYSLPRPDQLNLTPCVQSQPIVQDIITSDFECCIWEECAPPNTVVGPQRNVPLLSVLTHHPISTLIGPINWSKNE